MPRAAILPAPIAMMTVAVPIVLFTSTPLSEHRRCHSEQAKRSEADEDLYHPG